MRGSKMAIRPLLGGAAIALALAVAPQAAATTYTLEPFDLDGVLGINMNLTQGELGGSLCPCVKIPYTDDLLHNQEGVDNLNATPLKAGDTVLAFSNGSNIVSSYLNQDTPPPGVNFILLGSPQAGPNGRFIAYPGLAKFFGPEIPADTPDPVNVVAREYEGWSDYPDITTAPGYNLAVRNAEAGLKVAGLHNYTTADLSDPANIVTVNGNITTTLIPTATLPINDRLRELGLTKLADQRDAQMRPLIDAAYSRQGSQPVVAVPEHVSLMQKAKAMISSSRAHTVTRTVTRTVTKAHRTVTRTRTITRHHEVAS